MRSALAIALLLVPVAAATQQRPAGVEASIAGVAALARQAFVGGALGLGWRGAGQGRVMLTVAGGVLGSDPAARVELSGHFLLNPAARSGATLYGALGAAYVAVQGAGAGYVLLLMGAERAARAGGRGSVGWFVEGGVGGGARVAAGVRVRRSPRLRR